MPRKSNDDLHNLLALRMIVSSEADHSFLGKYVKLKTLQNLARSDKRYKFDDDIDVSTLLMLGYNLHNSCSSCNNKKKCAY